MYRPVKDLFIEVISHVIIKANNFYPRIWDIFFRILGKEKQSDILRPDKLRSTSNNLQLPT